MKKIPVIFFLLLTLSLSALAQSESEHEYAPLERKEIKYKDWTYKNVRSNEDFNLLGYTKDKKLVMVFYFAPWCHSSKYQSPVTQKLFDKYKDKGLGVVGVSLYASMDKIENTLKFYRFTFPVVAESLFSTERKDTQHYKYRTKTGDKRKWGTPYNVFLIPGELNEKDDVLANETFVVNGEIIETEVEKFIREKLGLPAENESAEITSKKNEVTPCEDGDKTKTALKKTDN